VSFIGGIAQGAPIGVAIVDRPEELAAFRAPECAAAIWRRPLDQRMRAWLDKVDPDRLPNGRATLHREAVRDALTKMCAYAQTPTQPEMALLIDDATALSEIFADLMGSRHLSLRLQAVATNACARFHVDAITAPLVCTYRGTGTQYGTSVDGTAPKRIFTVPAGAPILLRGSLWSETPSSGLRHSSPLIEVTGETRLVLVVDPVFDSEEAA
jgi:hypothetical protein